MNRNESERPYGVVEAGRAGAPLYLAPPYQDVEDDAEEAKLPLSQYFLILRRYRWRISGAVAATVLATLVLSARLTPIYESTATVDIDRQSPAGVVGDEATRSALNDADQFMATQIKLVESDAVLRPVDEHFHLRKQEGQAAALSPRGEAAPVTLKELKVARPPNTYLMQIGYRSADPQLAADAANAITQSYLEHSYEIRLRSSAGVARFMERQIEELKAKMERSSRALNEFERELNVINPEEKTNILSARLLQLNTEFTNAQSERLKRESEYQSVSAGSLEAALAAPQGEALRKLTEHRNEAAEHFVEVQSHYGANHPEFRKAAAQVEQVNTAIQATQQQIVERTAIGYREAQGHEAMVGEAVRLAKLDIEVHCRVLLTTPFETFSIGHTIVISRGLIDVLPDEGSLALTLASELAHIALGHATQTQFAFNNQTMLSDPELLQRFRFERPADELQAASEKAFAMMRASPYSNLANAGLFLKALAARRAAMPRLLQASLGDQVADAAALARLASFAEAAPALETNKLDQIAALPLGSRVKLDPWTNQLALVKTRPLTLLSPREKMPFEVTPFVLYLTRIAAISAKK